MPAPRWAAAAMREHVNLRSIFSGRSPTTGLPFAERHR